MELSVVVKVDQQHEVVDGKCLQQDPVDEPESVVFHSQHRETLKDFVTSEETELVITKVVQVELPQLVHSVEEPDVS